MIRLKSNKWIIISFFSLFIVAVLGVIMRYKIAYSFPFLDQKNIQHAHSHFAFAGWISQTLFFFLTRSLRSLITDKKFMYYNYLLWANWVTALGMLICFMLQGYGFYSILFSSLSILISFVFTIMFWPDIKHHPNIITRQWFKWALIFMLLSSLGTLSLTLMMATKNIHQHTYLASVYWYLHFQYNGWFFFGCMGLLYDYLGKKYAYFATNLLAFRLIAYSCVPAYGLSILWMHLPIWIEIVFALAAMAQALGWGNILYYAYKQKILKELDFIQPLKWLLVIIAIAGSIKFVLQLGSTIPAVSQLAFGFRSIVIAYLHLVLLAFISLFLVTYAYMTKLSIFNKYSFAGIAIFVVGILLNELLLGIQGIASIGYILIPFINESLFFVSLLLMSGIGIILMSQFALPSKSN
ncbi:MAG: hypothetical protein MUC81_13520 [Bacteroidia bacterium]|jgi:hypothetical protein|nr:hypothetical protein [Bacteroidia bacterium]